MIFDKHLFICVNQRAPESQKRSCGEAQGLELVSAFKKKIKELNLPIKIRAQKAGCLDVCDFGPTLVVYPAGIFYVGINLTDVDEIVEEHLVNNRPVERLILKKAR